MFHLLTHAFFKALLFLERRRRHPRARRPAEPRTAWAACGALLPVANLGVLVGCLAIAGIPPFSGFFSKDEIIAGALEAGDLGVVLGIVGILGAGPDGLLHVPPLLPRLLGPGRPRAATTCAHPHPPRLGDGRAGDRPRGRRDLHRLAPGPGRLAARGRLARAGAARRARHRGRARPVEVDRLGRQRRRSASSPSPSPGGSSSPTPRRRERLAGVAPATRELLLDQYRFDDVYEQAVVQPGRDLGDVMTRDVERYGVQGSMEGVARSLVDAGRGLRADPERPGARLRLRDDRRRGDPRGHLHPGDAVAACPGSPPSSCCPLIGALSMLAVPRGAGRRAAGAHPRPGRRRRHPGAHGDPDRPLRPRRRRPAVRRPRPAGPRRSACRGTSASTASRCGCSP